MKDNQRRAEYGNQIEHPPSKTHMKTLGVIGFTCRNRDGLTEMQVFGRSMPSFRFVGEHSVGSWTKIGKRIQIEIMHAHS